MKIFEMADKLKIIRISGNSYIGVIDEKNKLVQHAMDYSTNQINDWFRLFNVGELESLHLSDTQGYSIKSLNKNEKMTLEKCKAIMANVKKYALEYWENDLFSEHYSWHTSNLKRQKNKKTVITIGVNMIKSVKYKLDNEERKIIREGLLFLVNS